MKITVAIDKQLLERVRAKLRVSGKTVNQEIREHFQHIVGDDAQLASDLDFLDKFSGSGNSDGWKWNREELYQRR